MKRFLISMAMMVCCLSSEAASPLRTKDQYRAEGEGIRTLDRKVTVRRTRDLDKGLVSSYTVELGMKTEDIDFLIPGILYGPVGSETALETRGSTLPLIMARDRSNGRTVAVIRTDRNPGQGLLEIVTDEGMAAIRFGFPVREKKSGYSLRIEESSTEDYTEAVMDAWESAYLDCAPEYTYIDQEELYDKLSLISEDGYQILRYGLVKEDETAIMFGDAILSSWTERPSVADMTALVEGWEAASAQQVGRPSWIEAARLYADSICDDMLSGDIAGKVGLMARLYLATEEKKYLDAVLKGAEWYLENRRGTACIKPWEDLGMYMLVHAVTLDGKWLEAANEAAGLAETYLWSGIADEELASLAYDYHRLFVLTQNGHFRDVALRLSCGVAIGSTAHLTSMIRFLNEFRTPDIYTADRLVLQWFD